MKQQWYLVVLVTGVLACNNAPKNNSSVPGNQPVKAEPSPAMVQLYKTIAQYPDSTGLRLQLVDALDSMGTYPPALLQLDSMIGKDSLNFGLWYRKALVQEHAKDTAGALHAYRNAAAIYPSPDALLSMANLYAEQKDSKALQLCARVNGLRLGREYAAHCFFISGVYYARTGNRQKAIPAFNNCIANNYLYMEAYMEKGFALFDMKQTAAALQVFETATTVKGTYADAWYWRAKCEEALNQTPEAIRDYQAALSIDPHIPEAVTALKKLGVTK